MTTGRINQVTIINGYPGGPPIPARTQAEQFAVALSALLPFSTQGSSIQAQAYTCVNGEIRGAAATTLTSSRDPIAPTEFPISRSATHDCQRTRRRSVSHRAHRRRIPVARHIRRRIQAWAYPQVSWDRVDHRSVIHRLHQSPLVAK